ncbi:MAG: DUF86 domain-containing protein [Schwartzia sp.]|nr:DUF86 domain-containing protein [Schwartzia sp. (in: firmicutes)]
MNIRDKQILEHMVRYCKEILGALNRFGNSKESFMDDYIFYNACSMSLFQLGELSKRLSDEFRETYPDLPWKEMRTIRNVFAHEYERSDKESLWNTIQNDIPALHEKLQAIYQSDTTIPTNKE